MGPIGGAAQPPVREVGSTVAALDPSRGGGVYPVYASADLQAGNATARLAIVIVHGRLRNAADYFATGSGLVADAGAAGRDTIVVALAISASGRCGALEACRSLSALGQRLGGRRRRAGTVLGQLL